MGDVLKGSAILTLVGGVLGFARGAALLVCWSSLATSPFASTKWSWSIEFETPRDLQNGTGTRHDDREGAIVTTNDPMALYVFFSPVRILGGVGAIAGMVYGYGRLAAAWEGEILRVPILTESPRGMVELQPASLVGQVALLFGHACCDPQEDAGT